MDEPGIEDMAGAQMRLAATTALHAAEIIAQRVRHAQQRQLGAASESAARAQSRLAAERDTARATLAVASRPGWLDQATLQEVGDVLGTAEAWAERDELARQTRDRLHEELRDRGIDPTTATAWQREAETERSRAREDSTEALALVGAAEQLDRAGEVDPDTVEAQELHDESHAASGKADAAWDSAERRDQLSDALASRGIEAPAVESRMRADVAQARPASEAVKVKSRRWKKPARRGNRQRGRVMDRGRD